MCLLVADIQQLDIQNHDIPCHSIHFKNWDAFGTLLFAHQVNIHFWGLLPYYYDEIILQHFHAGILLFSEWNSVLEADKEGSSVLRSYGICSLLLYRRLLALYTRAMNETHHLCMFIKLKWLVLIGWQLAIGQNWE